MAMPVNRIGTRVGIRGRAKVQGDMEPSDTINGTGLASLLGVIWKQDFHISHTPANPFNTDISTYQTIQLMIRLAKVSAHSPLVHSAILTATQGISPSNLPTRALARAIFYWVNGNVQFVEDETLLYKGLGIDRVDKELLISPEIMLGMPVPMGDCDDFSLLTASMLLAAGIPCSYLTIAADEKAPEKFSHVYVKAYLVDEMVEGKARELVLDCSHGSYPGWEYQGALRKQEWFIS